MSLDVAISLDARDRPLEAIDAYERAIQEPNADRQAFFNLVALYFLLMDHGFASNHQVPSESVKQAWKDANRVLHLAAQNFGSDPEIRFWRLYLPFVVLGEEPDLNSFRGLMKEGKTLLPTLLLLGLAGGERYEREARKLLQSLKGVETARARYIRSVVEATLRRMKRELTT